MGRDKRNEQRTEQFAKWVKHEAEREAWKALSFPARDAYMHLKVRCFAEGSKKWKKRLFSNNNGKVGMSPRNLAELMGCSEKTAARSLADLQAKGWIICTNLGYLGLEGKGVQSSWRLTMLNTSDCCIPSSEPREWSEGNNYDVIIYSGSVPKPRKGRAKNFTKNENPPPNRVLDCPLLEDGRGESGRVLASE